MICSSLSVSKQSILHLSRGTWYDGSFHHWNGAIHAAAVMMMLAPCSDPHPASAASGIMVRGPGLHSAHWHWL